MLMLIDSFVLSHYRWLWVDRWHQICILKFAK
jgi:hypothetical protein